MSASTTSNLSDYTQDIAAGLRALLLVESVTLPYVSHELARMAGIDGVMLVIHNSTNTHDPQQLNLYRVPLRSQPGHRLTADQIDPELIVSDSQLRIRDVRVQDNLIHIINEDDEVRATIRVDMA